MRKTNYHTHTARCMHANGKDEEYVLAAIEAGYEELGFSDHTPWKYDSDFVAHMRMRLDQFDEYYNSIKKLQEKYKNDIKILIGLECEYYPKYMKWLESFVKEYELDYIILGNHYYDTDEKRIYYGRYCQDDSYVTKYIDGAIEGMKTGLYSYLAHPDLFMRGKIEFDDFAKEESYRLCKIAKELDIPLEYNLAGAQYNDELGKEQYPHREFWKIVAEVGNKAIIGVDAHDPSALRTDYYRNQAIERLKKLKIEIVDHIDCSKIKEKH